MTEYFMHVQYIHQITRTNASTFAAKIRNITNISNIQQLWSLYVKDEVHFNQVG